MRVRGRFGEQVAQLQDALVQREQEPLTGQHRDLVVDLSVRVLACQIVQELIDPGEHVLRRILDRSGTRTPEQDAGSRATPARGSEPVADTEIDVMEQDLGLQDVVGSRGHGVPGELRLGGAE